MGLFLGASILSVTELIEFMLFVIWYMCVYLTRRNVMVYTGNMTKHVQVVKRQKLCNTLVMFEIDKNMCLN